MMIHVHNGTVICIINVVKCNISRDIITCRAIEPCRVACKIDDVAVGRAGVRVIRVLVITRTRSCVSVGVGAGAGSYICLRALR